MNTLNKLTLERIGQIRQADIEFGDLTILVGPQATGKSIFLQFLKLVLDTGYVHDQLHRHGIDWARGIPDFLDVYFGEGMRGIWRDGDEISKITIDGAHQSMKDLASPKNRTRKASLFYIPAQRVLTLANGWPRPFQGFASEDPFMVRDFSETFRQLMDKEFSRSADLFPKTKRLKQEYRKLLSANVFGGFGLQVDRHGAQKRLVLKSGSGKPIPFMAWSAGQREFVPLLMGLYWLMPAAAIQTRGDLKWVVIEEPEMGLHPNAISTVLMLVLELLWRGYRVCLSTHSQHVLDVAWAMRIIREKHGDPERLLDVFKANRNASMRAVAESALEKNVKVYHFGRNGTTQDISELDPGSENTTESGWGGLSEFSGNVADVVANVVNKATIQ